MRIVWCLALAAAASGCARQSSPDSPDPGELVAIWEGREPGRMRVAAEALYCARDSVIELLAFDNDRAVALAFYLDGEAITTGEVPVMPPAGDSLRRPSVAGAFRAMQRDILGGYQAREGQVEIVHVGTDLLTGRYSLLLTERSTMDPLPLRGAFREVPVRPAAEPCGRRGPAAGAGF